MKRLWIIGAAAGFLLLPSNAAPGQEGVNLVKNGGFEKADPGNVEKTLEGWTLQHSGDYSVSLDEGHEGKYSISIFIPPEHPKSKYYSVFLISDRFPVESGVWYTLRLWYKSPEGVPGVIVQGRAKGTGASSLLGHFKPPPAETWTLYETNIYIPPGEVIEDKVQGRKFKVDSCYIELFNYHRPAWRMWFDDVEFYPIPPDKHPLRAQYDRIGKKTSFLKELRPRFPATHDIAVWIDGVVKDFAPIRQAFAAWDAASEQKPLPPDYFTATTFHLLQKVENYQKDLDAVNYSIWSTADTNIAFPYAIPPGMSITGEGPAANSAVSRIPLKAGATGVEGGRIFISNLSDREIDFRIRSKHGRLTVCASRFVLPEEGGGAAFSEFWMANEINEVVVLPGLTAEIRILPSPGLKAGAYKDTLSVIPMNRSLAEQKVDVDLKIESEQWNLPAWCVRTAPPPRKIESAELKKAPAYIVWRKSPWLRVSSSDRPSQSDDVSKFRAVMTLADIQPAVLCVMNNTGLWMPFRIITSELEQRVPGLKITVRRSTITPAEDIMRANPSACIIGEKAAQWTGYNGVGHPLFKLDEGGELVVPPGQTSEIWLDLETSSNTPPGVYRAPVVLEPGIAGIPGKKMELELKVQDLRLPDRGPLKVYMFDYAQNEGQLEDMVRHKVTTFMGQDLPGLSLKDGRVAMKMEPRNRLKAQYGQLLCSYGMFRDYVQWAEKNKIEFMGAEFKLIFTDAVKEWAAYYKSLGLEYVDFPVQSWDEAQDADIAKTIELGRLVRETDPNIKLALTTVCSLEEAERLRPWTDLWIPHMGITTADAWRERWREFFRKEKELGKEIWSYSCSTPPQCQDPIAYYIMSAWKAWDMGYSGISFFAWSSIVMRTDMQAVPIPNRPWEAVREAADDYQHLWLLKEEIAEAIQRGVAEDRIQKAQGTLNRSVQRVLQGGKGAERRPDRDPALVTDLEWAREVLGDEIVALRMAR